MTDEKNIQDDIIYINETVKILMADMDHLRKQLKVAQTNINDLTIRVSTLETDLEGEKKRTRAWNDNLLDQIHDEKDKVRYIYVIRERAKMCEDGWNIVGNVVYPTFNDANEKLKKLIKDYRQLDPDYEAENLNIIQVRLEG